MPAEEERQKRKVQNSHSAVILAYDAARIIRDELVLLQATRTTSVGRLDRGCDFLRLDTTCTLGEHG